LSRRLRWAAVLLLLLAAGGWWGLRAVNGEEAEWVDVVRDDLVLDLEVTGTLKAVETDLIGPPQLQSLWQFKIAQMATEGEEVQAGTPILGFDKSELQQRLQRELAERDAAAKRVEKAEKELEVKRRQDQLRLDEARATLRKAELKAESPAELEAANELALVKLELELAQRQVEYLEARLESARRSAQASLAALRSQLQAAEQQVVWTGQEIEQMTVVAGRDGTVIHVSNWNGEKKSVGDTCWKGESVLELPNLEEMRALGMVHEADAGRLVEGQRVRLRLDAHPDVEFEGTIASIWSTVQRESWRTPKKVVRVDIELDETDTMRMRPGMRFRGSIEAERIDGALTVDADAVFLEPSGPVVYRRTWRGHEAVEVELGRRNARQVEVLAGLAEGDRVALTDLGRGAS
jgi:multidrug efflux pump subunit AcrA (membrane-fusion protein)